MESFGDKFTDNGGKNDAQKLYPNFMRDYNREDFLIEAYKNPDLYPELFKAHIE